jgi:sugar phosphate isomerase/epimerase
VSAMILGINSYCYRHLSVRQALKVMAELGFNNIELVSFCHLPFNPLDDAKVDDVKGALKQNGQTVYSYYSAGFDMNNISTAENACIVAGELGANLLVGTGTAHKGGNRESALKGLQALDRLLSRYGLRFALENHWRNIVETTEDMKGMVQGCSESIGFTVDTGHFVSTGIDPMSALMDLLPRTYNIHLKDVKEQGAHENVPYGEGRARIDDILSALSNGGYKGPITIEYEPETGDPTVGIRKCLEFLSMAGYNI